MTKEELAEKLNGRQYERQYCHEISNAEEKQVKSDGLVVVFAASDDLMEFRGAIDDEVGVYGGGEVLLDTRGILPNRKDIEDDEELKDFFARQPGAVKIKAVWHDEGEYSWTYKTDIPCVTFDIVEPDSESTLYCRGIVFNLSDAHK